MTIDWLVVLAPLAALPVVLLLGFVGCPVAELPILRGIALEWDNGYNGDIESLQVTFRYFPTGGESSSSYIVSATLTGTELASFFGGTPVDKSNAIHFSDVPDGELACFCVLTQTMTHATILLGDSQPMVVDRPFPGQPAGQPFEAMNRTPGFSLSRIGTGFDTTNFLLEPIYDPN